MGSGRNTEDVTGVEGASNAPRVEPTSFASGGPKRSASHSFQFTSDRGKHDGLDSRGAVSLTAGMWSGSCNHEALSTQSSVPLPCESPVTSNCVVVHAPTYPRKVSDAWSLTLTPVGSSY